MHIAIIGAGISGLSCASQLALAGHQIDVFEKSRGVGGRMCTRRTAHWECDHGARYFTARDPAFKAQVAQWQADGTVAVWTPRLAVFDDDVWTSPPASVERYVGTAQMNSPLKALEVAVQTGCTIDSIEHDNGKWTLSCKETGRFPTRYDALVLALPAPQASVLLGSLSAPLSGVANSAVMQGCWTMMLNFNAAPELSFDAAFINQGRLSWIANNSHKPQRTGLPTWVLHANTDWSEQHLDSDAAEVSQLLIASFVELTGLSPDAFTSHRWRYASTANKLSQRYAFDQEINLGLCGDWLNGGRVEGAWLSGLTLAQRMLSRPHLARSRS